MESLGGGWDIEGRRGRVEEWVCDVIFCIFAYVHVIYTRNVPCLSTAQS